MAKFRRNHADSDKRPAPGSSTKGKSLKYIIWLLMIIALMYILTRVDTPTWEGPADPERQGLPDVSISDEEIEGVSKNFLPESTTGEVIAHKHYTLSYSEDHEQAEWVAYKLTKKNLQKPRVARAKKFNPDKQVSTTSAYHNDYSHSGYTRGHMVPAGDMTFSTEAMQQTFYMSNMSPQVKECNGGIWRELEETVRDWAYADEELYIVSGPVLTDGHIITKIGRNEVSVPDLFYKIILDNHGDQKKAIAFLIPNAKSEQPLSEYAVTIDEVEDVVGIDFFADFLSPETEKTLESEIDLSQWKFDQTRYNTRINKWNKW